jgi:hypothetical protein
MSIYRQVSYLWTTWAFIDRLNCRKIKGLIDTLNTVQYITLEYQLFVRHIPNHRLSVTDMSVTLFRIVRRSYSSIQSEHSHSQTLNRIPALPFFRLFVKNITNVSSRLSHACRTGRTVRQGGPYQGGSWLETRRTIFLDRADRHSRLGGPWFKKVVIIYVY